MTSRCTLDPSGPEYKNAPIGMLHCPICGEMVLAGAPHPDYDELPPIEGTTLPPGEPSDDFDF